MIYVHIILVYILYIIQYIIHISIVFICYFGRFQNVLPGRRSSCGRRWPSLDPGGGSLHEFAWRSCPFRLCVCVRTIFLILAFFSHQHAGGISFILWIMINGWFCSSIFRFWFCFQSLQTSGICTPRFLTNLWHYSCCIIIDKYAHWAKALPHKFACAFFWCVIFCFRFFCFEKVREPRFASDVMHFFSWKKRMNGCLK